MMRATLLLVDDKPANLLALEAVLGKSDYDLLYASNGEEALNLLRVHEVALIILDVQMPGIDGFETARRIKKIDRCADIPIIFVTAVYNEDPFIKKGYEVGAIDYFGKPFDPDILRLKVKLYVSFQQKSILLRERERQVRESEELLRTGQKLAGILETLPVGVIIADAEGRICQVNEEVVRIWGAMGVQESDSYGRYLGWWDKDGKLLKSYKSPLGRAIHGELTHTELMRIRGFDGIAKTIMASASPLRALDNHIVGAVVVIQDVTERKKVEEDLAQRIKKVVSISVEIQEATHH